MTKTVLNGCVSQLKLLQQSPTDWVASATGIDFHGSVGWEDQGAGQSSPPVSVLSLAFSLCPYMYREGASGLSFSYKNMNSNMGAPPQDLLNLMTSQGPHLQIALWGLRALTHKLWRDTAFHPNNGITSCIYFIGLM